ncbi:MAG: tRNA pseudouridine(38-40) synthase TruA [Deltaproteobacteria bacterium]|nr:tRNA pseudouridine(38-40) synthase TruA [Deltaproteobacteria bacterium]
MRNIKLLIAFDGTAYSGWQRQKGPPTIQGVLEDRIALMTGGSVTLHGAGRTDAGVHALGMVANFHTTAKIPCQGFMKGLNSLLPDDIKILGLEDAPAGFHARFSAHGKTYLYQAITAPVIMPVKRLYYSHFPGEFNLSRMNEALALLIGEHDFSSFEAAGSRDPRIKRGRGAVRKIFAVGVAPLIDDNGFMVTIHGDGFLRHMVRNIVGTLVEVGSGKKNIDNFAEILYCRDRFAAGATALACGLFLREIFY